MEGNAKQGSLEVFLSQSKFKKQADYLGSEVFFMLSRLYLEGLSHPESKALFPDALINDFQEIHSELSHADKQRKSMLYNYLVAMGAAKTKEVLGKSYDSIMEKKRLLLDKLGYSSIYKNFVNAQAGDSLMEAEGDEFFYINGSKGHLNDYGRELIWVFAKTVEFLYETVFE